MKSTPRRRITQLCGHLGRNAVAGGEHTKLLEGITVIEMATVIAAPSCAAILSDLGANVIKVERPGGDTWRSSKSMFENDNRGKRSVCIDITDEAGKEMLFKLLDQADVFVTNIRGQALTKLGCDYKTLSARYPRLIFGWLTAHGMEGPDVDLPGYDIGAFWARSGELNSVARIDTVSVIESVLRWELDHQV